MSASTSPSATTVKTPYEDLLREILADGAPKADRTGTGTRSLFARQIRYDLSEGFPLLTTKKVHLKSIIYELLWFLRGDSNATWLQERGVTIWDEWADADGRHIDQISRALATLQNNPDSRRNIVSAWNVSELENMALPPCHLLFQFYVADGKLSCQLYQRSADMFLGVPFNIASYALLTHMFAQQAGLEVGEFIHIYDNHVEQCELQVSRDARPYPTLQLRKAESLFDYDFDDVEVVGYDPHPPIRGQVSV